MCVCVRKRRVGERPYIIILASFVFCFVFSDVVPSISPESHSRFDRFKHHLLRPANHDLLYICGCINESVKVKRPNTKEKCIYAINNTYKFVKLIQMVLAFFNKIIFHLKSSLYYQSISLGFYNPAQFFQVNFIFNYKRTIPVLIR